MDPIERVEIAKRENWEKLYFQHKIAIHKSAIWKKNFCHLIQIQSNTISSRVQNSIYFHFDRAFFSSSSVHWMKYRHLYRLFSVNRGAILLKDSMSWLLKWDFKPNAYATRKDEANLRKYKLIVKYFWIFDWYC